MIYLSAPDRDIDFSIETANYNHAGVCLGKLLRAGFRAVCQTPLIDRRVRQYEQWEAYDSRELREELVSVCSGVVVLMGPHWQASREIMEDLQAAHKFNKPIIYLEPDEFSNNPAVLYGRINEEMSHDKYQPKEAPQPTNEQRDVAEPIASAACC